MDISRFGKSVHGVWTGQLTSAMRWISQTVNNATSSLTSSNGWKLNLAILRMKLTRAHLVIGIWDEYWAFLTESARFNSSRVGAYILTKANLEKLVRQRQAGKQSSLQNITEQLAGLQKWNEEIHVPAWNLGCRYNYGCGLKPPDCPTTNISSSTPLCSV